MIVGFSKHGRGRAQGAINYLLSERGGAKAALGYLIGEKNRAGIRRTPLPVVVRGNPTVTQKLINSVPFTWRYTSGVLSFSRGETVTPEMEQKIMNGFEAAAFAGLAKDRYSIVWIRHSHTGREELHFVVPRLELRSGKSLNIAPPGKASRLLFDTFRSKINAEYGLSDPDDPSRRRGLSFPAHVAKLKDATGKNRAAYSADVREGITRLVVNKAREGKIQNRQDVIRELTALGFGIHRQGEKYLTVIHPVNKEHFRLRGAWYEKQWSGNPLSASQSAVADRARVEKLKSELERLCRDRSEYNLKRYHSVASPIYDRTGFSITGSRQTARIATPTARAEIDARAQRIDEADQRWNRACRNLERASDRFGRAHRAIANGLERKIAECERRKATTRLLARYGISQSRSHSIELEHDLEPEMEIV